MSHRYLKGVSRLLLLAIVIIEIDLNLSPVFVWYVLCLVFTPELDSCHYKEIPEIINREEALFWLTVVEALVHGKWPCCFG